MHIVERTAGFAELTVADRFLDESHLTAARRVLDKVVNSVDIRLAFVGGSLAAGLGHGNSDIDLYISARTDLREGNLSQDGYTVQVNPITSNRLEELARICAANTISEDNRWQVELGEPELKRAVRYAIGTILVDNYSGLPTPAVARRTMRQVLMSRTAWYASSFAEDVAGALHIGDGLTALQASVIGVEEAVECALTAVDDLYIGRKFLLRRVFRNAALSAVSDDVYHLLSQPVGDLSLREVTEIVTRRMRFAGHLIAWSLREGWDTPLRSLPAFPDTWTHGGPTRNPWTIPIRFPQSWGLISPQTGFSTTAAMVGIWRESDGRPTDELYHALRTRDEFDGISPELLDAALTQLVECDVVALATNR
ncbi:nucleotidyltransferase domain-containing protein [Nocardia terpenica]|uniref:Polymerase nucleotidyl transferase domain-containing protein n=1 Tax=Nocardia terpenica TaxID=455432 RepID=A0A291RFU5_9NOCA|nr:hypothetical protein [Nocardia terpenica]ATL66170.1 hypothetical protein CRH09_08045 [Nocardia terpenica]